MKRLLILILAVFSPILMAQSFDLDELEDTAPAPAPAVEEKVEQPVVQEVVQEVVQPKQEVKVEPAPVVAVDKYKNFRCSAGKFTNVASARGPLNDAEDLIIDLLGVGKPLNRKLTQADTNDPSRPLRGGEKFSLSGQRGILELGMPKGFLGAWVWVPAKMCVSDSNQLIAVVDASQHGKGILQVTLTRHGADTFRMSGQTQDGSIKVDGLYRREMSEVSR